MRPIAGFSFEKISDMLPAKKKVEDSEFVCRDDFAIALSVEPARHGDSPLKVGEPFRLGENRIIRVLRGRLVCRAGLLEYPVSAGGVVILRQGTIVEMSDASPDLKLQMLSYARQETNSLAGFDSRGITLARPSHEVWEECGQLFGMIYAVAVREPFNAEAAYGLVHSLGGLIAGAAADVDAYRRRSRKEKLFDGFLQLVAGSDCKHSIPYYAERLCITPNYLSRVVLECSGHTAMYWINKSVILNARTMLKSSSAKVVSIAEALGFPNAAFFCRFFKRETGMTPKACRRI